MTITTTTVGQRTIKITSAEPPVLHLCSPPLPPVIIGSCVATVLQTGETGGCQKGDRKGGGQASFQDPPPTQPGGDPHQISPPKGISQNPYPGLRLEPPSPPSEGLAWIHPPGGGTSELKRSLGRGGEQGHTRGYIGNKYRGEYMRAGDRS